MMGPPGGGPGGPGYGPPGGQPPGPKGGASGQNDRGGPMMERHAFNQSDVGSPPDLEDWYAEED